MKRLVGLLVASLMIAFATNAYAAFVSGQMEYYLMPVQGGTATYTISGSGTSGSPYAVDVTSSSGGTVDFDLYCSILETDSIATNAGVDSDTLALANTPGSSPNTLPGQFLSNGTPPSISTTTPGVVTLPALLSTGGQGVYNGGLLAGAIASPGLGGAGTWYVGGPYSTGGSAPSTSNYVRLGGPSQLASSSSYYNTGALMDIGPTGTPVAGQMNGPVAGHSDFVVGTFQYSVSSTGLTAGQTATLDVQQAHKTALWYGEIMQDGVTAYGGVEATVDAPLTVTYTGAALPGDNSVLTLTPSTLALGRLLKGGTGYLAGGSIVDTIAANTGYSLTNSDGNLTGLPASGGTLALNGTQQLGSPGLGIHLTSTVMGTAGPIATTTLNLINTGNNNATSSMTVTADVIASRPLGVTVALPSTVNGSDVLVGSQYQMNVTDASTTNLLSPGHGNDNYWSEPNVVNSGTTVFGVTLNATAGTISSSTPAAGQPGVATYASAGSAGSGSSNNIDLAAAGVVTGETGLGETLVNNGTGHLYLTAPSVTVTNFSGTVGAQARGGGGSGAYGPVLNGGLVAAPVGPTLPTLTSSLLPAQGSLHSNGGNGTAATLYELFTPTTGSSTTGGALALQWRQTTVADVAKLPAGLTFFASDVVNVSGETGDLAMTMTYDPTLFGDGTGLAAGTAGKLFLGYLTTGATPAWTKVGTTNEGNISWSSFRAENPSALLSSLVGDYGFNTATDTVWAVMNTANINSGGATDFAAVPEPGTLALLGAGLALGLLFIRRKRTKDLSV